jgi:hypothetical protein
MLGYQFRGDDFVVFGERLDLEDVSCGDRWRGQSKWEVSAWLTAVRTFQSSWVR